MSQAGLEHLGDWRGLARSALVTLSGWACTATGCSVEGLVGCDQHLVAWGLHGDLVDWRGLAEGRFQASRLSRTLVPSPSTVAHECTHSSTATSWLVTWRLQGLGPSFLLNLLAWGQHVDCTGLRCKGEGWSSMGTLGGWELHEGLASAAFGLHGAAFSIGWECRRTATCTVRTATCTVYGFNWSGARRRFRA